MKEEALLMSVGTRILLGTAAVCALAVMPGAPVAAEEIVLQLWSRADRSGPMRPANILSAAEVLNGMLASAGADQRVKVEVFENNATGFDQDALDMLQACAVDRCPDFYVAAHEWIGEFANSGYAMNMEEFVRANPWAFDDIIPVFWDSVKVDGEIHAIPQDSEIRMFFYNKDMLREIGKDEAFIESLPAMVEAGEFTIWDFGELVKEVVDAGAAEFGLLHRPNAGPDYLMTFAAFGVKFQDLESGKLLLPKAEVLKAFEWFDWMARNGATPENNTSMSWDDVQNAFKQERAFAYHHGVWTMDWQLGDARGNVWPEDPEGYFEKIGWIHAPPAEQGGQPTNLSHPIVYAVNPQSERAELAAQIVALATLPYFNTLHAVDSYHTGVLHGQESMPAYEAIWPLHTASELIERSTFMPNHPEFGRYNGLLFTALQGVETGRLSPDEAIEFLADEMEIELGDELLIVDSLASAG
jgi:inositol-phosphate transport system substrate-binding protein